MYTPFFTQTLELFTTLITDVDEIENKIKVVQCLAILVERLEGRITPFAKDITALLPGLWASSGDAHLFKTSILSILTSLTRVS